MKNELNEKNKQLEDLASGSSVSSLQAELIKLKAYTEDLKKLEVAKDLEINKLNDRMKFKDKEIDKLNQTIKDNKPIDYSEKEKEMVSAHQQEMSQLSQKINDLELRIYKLNEDKKQLSLENFGLQEKLSHFQAEKEKPKEESKEVGVEDKEDHLNESEESSCVPKDTYNSLVEEFEIIKKQLDTTQSQLTSTQTQLGTTKFDLESIKVLYNESQSQLSNTQKRLEDIQQKLSHTQAEIESKRKEINNLQSSQRDLTSDENYLKDIKYIKAKHEAELNQKDREYNLLKGETAKALNESMLKIKELEIMNKNLNIFLKQVTQGRNDLEEVIIKQEEKVSDLGDKVNRIDQLLKNKNSELKQNESYSIQLINIINDQKKHIASMRNNQKETDNNELVSMQNQVSSLKETIELRDVAIAQMQHKHKMLQEKYTKLSSEKRMKPQEELLKEAKEMKQNKIEKEKEKVRNRSSNKVKRSYNNNINEENNKVVPDSVLPPQIIPKVKPKSPFTQQHQPPIVHRQQKTSNSTLPLILNQEKPLFNMNSLNSVVEDTKMDEINNMMRKIIDEF